MSEMQIEVRKLSELRHPDRNARMHPDKQIAELKRSLKKDGQTRLMVIDEYGVIWIGNGLYQAMQEMGYEEAYKNGKELWKIDPANQICRINGVDYMAPIRKALGK